MRFVKSGFGVAALVLLSAGSSGCASMMMSAEQKQQTCDSYSAVIDSPQMTAEQRKQTIEYMKQMDCSNIPPA